jgi:hypothetical protein
MTSSGRHILLSMLVASVCCASRAAEPSFETDVLPILQANCFGCHGEKTQKAELSLTTQARLLEGGESGEIVVPGKPEESLLYEMLRDGDMPPEKAKQPVDLA